MYVFGISAVFLTYVLVYAAAAVVCLGAIVRARRVDDNETRRGLVALFVGSGGWAALELGFLVAPTPELKYVSYTLSLVVGLTTVGAWLFFCSAYTGRSFHRDPTYRRVAAVVYLLVVGVKLTNPLHQQYFTTEFVLEPFAHLTVMHGTLHWIITGLSYALVAVGFFMLYELFLESDYDTRPLGIVAALTGLPVVFDILGYATPMLIDMNYEPIGVAVFAVGVLYVFETEFLAIQLTDGVEDAVIYLSEDRSIRHANDQARALFPMLSGTIGGSFSAVLPSVAKALDSDDRILDIGHDGGRRHFLVTDTAVTLGHRDVARIVVLTDVTETERQRRELNRQNDQLEDFAAAIRHELLNTLQIVSGRVMLAGEDLERGNVGAARDSLRTASASAQRMSSIVDDLATLARHGQTLESTSRVGLAQTAEDAWHRFASDDLSLTLSADADVEGDGNRLHGLFESAFAFAHHNGATAVVIDILDDGFSITDNGAPVGDLDPHAFFEYGVSVPNAAAGMLLPNLRTLARTHGWNAELDTDYTEGIRVVVSGVTMNPRSEAAQSD